MSGDTLVYDLSSMTEGTPQVFVKKDWLNILDNQSGNYNGNQSVVDTSQLANSNKYLNYREAYLAVPMCLTATGAGGAFLINPSLEASSADYAFGLRNWFGTIIHSFTLDYNGTTIIQQTPYCSMWNTFRLMTTLSMSDVLVNGADMGFYPDDPLSWGFLGATTTTTGLSGGGTYNNANLIAPQIVSSAFTGYKRGNEGFLRRQNYINYDPDGSTGGGAGSATAGADYDAILPADRALQQYKSYVSLKTATAFQISIMATIHLKHIHNFFQNVPLLKGVFMKMTINLNQSQATITGAGAGGTTNPLDNVVVSTALGGVSPLMIASATAGSGCAGVFAPLVAGSCLVSISVGSRPYVASQATLTTGLNQSIMLYVPAYTFNPTYEDAYLSSPVKTIVYTDIYQYQTSVNASTTFNQLITNGIANIKSVLIIPYFKASANDGYLPFQSPFDDAGSGTTSPLCLLTNFNVVVAGANMIYNTQRYSYEQFLHQLRGCNAINADMTDGLTSGLIDKLGFEMKHSFYYVDCSRMLPVEEAVPKSVSIIGQNSTIKDLELFVFIEYGVQVSIDILTGARV
jgi:hypothetical protein